VTATPNGQNQFNLLLFFPDFFSSTTSAITTPIYFQTRTIRRT
jgi:hypothetical protein